MLTSDKTLKTVDASNYHSIAMMWRFLEISRYYSNMDGVLRAQFAYPNVTFRSIVAPTGTLPSSIYPLNLTQAEVDTAVSMGKSDAKNAALLNDAQDTLHYFALMKKKDPRVYADDLSYDDFVEMKRNGLFEDYNLFEDKHLEAIYTQ